MTRDDIINAVKVRIDELNPFSQEELNPSISLIDELLNESTWEVMMILPLYLLTPETFDTSSHTVSGRTGHVNLPNDFLRLYAFKMEYWATEVTEPIGVDNPKYKLQKYSATMGGVKKPVVVIKSNATGKVLYYYSLPSGYTHTITTSLYVKKQLPETIPNVTEILDFIAWNTAAKVLGVMGETELSNNAKQKLNELITTKTI